MDKEKFNNSFRENFNNSTKELKAKNLEIETLKTRILQLEKENDQLRTDHLIDPLTGCYNRTYLQQIIEKEPDPNSLHHKIALVFIDVNDLKKTNDTDGHKAGDKLIKDVAFFLESSFRENDIIIRLGGDEFVVICRSDRGIENFKEGLCPSLDKRLKKSSKFAFGVTFYDKNIDSNLIDTLHRADLLMYEHKKEIKSIRED